MMTIKVIHRVYIRMPGKVDNAQVFMNSSLYKGLISETLFQQRNRVIRGVDMPLLVLGDPAYLTLSWLMKPYPEHAGMTEQMKQYNYRQSQTCKSLKILRSLKRTMEMPNEIV